MDHVEQRVSRRRMLQSCGRGWEAGDSRAGDLFMNGGPFQGDFFDPKPALEKFAGERPAEVDLRTERATAGLLPSPFKFQPRGAKAACP
jgi:hypothetical protein